MNLVKHTIAIAAGKGGVGKSTLTVNLALACQELGFKVGILDADLYGPSISRMVAEELPPKKVGERIEPASGLGLSYISISSFHQGAALMRAPIVRNWLSIFSTQVDWGELDLLFVDFPPGTGDISLSLAQEMRFTGALLVTTPQLIAVQDVVKCAQMFTSMDIPLLGVVENMSFLASDPAQKPFGEGGGAQLADFCEIDLLGKIPLDSTIATCADHGVSLFAEGVGEILNNSDFPIRLSKSAKFDFSNSLTNGWLAPFSKINFASILKTFSKRAVVQCLSGEPFLAVAKKLLGKMKSSAKIELEKLELRETGIYVRFSDGKEGIIALRALQKSCPCVRCREAKESLTPIRVDANVRLRELKPVGSFAYCCYFDSGCSQGIYPHRLMRELL